MKLVTFCEIQDSVIDSRHTIEHFQNGCAGDAQVVILDINTIFDFEENKGTACAEEYVSIAILEDDSDYEAFKNFGIDAWIKQSDLGDINSLLNLIEKRNFS